MKSRILLLALIYSTSLLAEAQSNKPISLHPENPHYFLFRDKPTILITSAEHYGAVLNLDFDYIKYLDELKANGLNYTRIFSGTYYILPGDFGIDRSTLAPKPGRFISPWARSSTPGFNGGGNKFDLSKWDNNYFERLKDFVSEAGKRGIIVEVTLFSSLYNDKGWSYSPMKGSNNVNKINVAVRNDVLNLSNGNLLKYQEDMVRKIVAELQQYDNVFFELQNEPWAGGNDIEVLAFNKDCESLEYEKKLAARVANDKSLAWQAHIASIIVNEESKHKNKHLIAQNFINFKYKLPKVGSNISIVNFHYALSAAAKENQGLNKVIGFDESGMAGSNDDIYRKHGWRFIMSGGGLFNNLDYSFTTDKPDGTDRQKAQGAGSRALRNQIKILKDFIEGFDFIKMQPQKCEQKEGGCSLIYQLSEPDKQYAYYFEGITQDTISVDLPSGTYAIESVSVKDGVKTNFGSKNHAGGALKLTVPKQKDLALKIIKI